MANIYGALGVNDHERVWLSTLGQGLVTEAVQQTLAQFNYDMEAAMSIFVEEVTTDHKRRYKLPGGGRLARMGGQAPTATAKAYGGWDVAFPLEDFGRSVASYGIEYGYMTAVDLDRHISGVMQAYMGTVRHEVLKALFNSTAGTFVDKHWGSLTIERLANGDSVTFPPVLGSESEATDNHYLESGYAAANISDSNDPFVTMAAELEEHFGAPTGGSNIVAFINNAQVAKTRALTDFVEVVDFAVIAGSTISVPDGLPANTPGRIIGRHAGAGVWVSEWRWIPANYIVAVHMDAPKPLIKRRHPDYAGLPDGINLVQTSDLYPFTESRYEAHMGFGAGNRLNGVVMELGTGGTYTVPTAYQ